MSVGSLRPGSVSEAAATLGVRIGPRLRVRPSLSPTAGSVGRRGPGRRSGQGRGPGFPLYAQHAFRLLTSLCCLLRAVRRQEHLLQLRPGDPGPLSAQGETGAGCCVCVGGVWVVTPRTAGGATPAPGPLNSNPCSAPARLQRLRADLSVSLRPRVPV